MKKDAYISRDQIYRYWLTRTWDEALGRVCWVMLNPSTADANVDDRTIGRCIHFARAWGYGGISVVNLFAFRSTDPGQLHRVLDPVGEENERWIEEMARQAQLVVVGWGAEVRHFPKREARALDLFELNGIRTFCLGVTLEGYPGHPLYKKGSSKPVHFNRHAVGL